MVKYSYAERVVNKVRKLMKYNAPYNEVISAQPHISLNLNYELESISWSYGGLSLLVLNNSIQIQEGYGPLRVIVSYDSFDGLLAMK